MRTRIGILGLGNLGRSCINQIEKRADEFELVSVFSRRKLPGTIHIEDLDKYRSKIDVLLVCVGSQNDAPTLVPNLAKTFNIVDSYDNHINLPSYVQNVASSATTTTAIVATGWDPGLFSIVRMYLRATMPNANLETFWGTGVSLGHTNAIKTIKGVKQAIQFTVPISEAKEQARAGEALETHEKHRRVAYIIANPKDHKRIEKSIKTMPHYFEPYQTEVNFVTEDEFNSQFKDRQEHAGCVISGSHDSKAEFLLKLDSNPKFTASVMLAYAKACHKLHRENQFGCYTVADIAPKYLVTDVTQLL